MTSPHDVRREVSSQRAGARRRVAWIGILAAESDAEGPDALAGCASIATQLGLFDELDGAKRALTDEDPASPKVEALIEAMFLAATSDGEFAIEERGQFAATIEALTNRKLSREAIDQRADRLGAQLRSEGRQARLSAVAARLPAGKGRETALMLAAAITASDGVVERAENNLLADLADALEIGPARAVDLISRAQSGGLRPAVLARAPRSADAHVAAPARPRLPRAVSAAATLWTAFGALGVVTNGYILAQVGAYWPALVAFGAGALFLMMVIGTKLGVPNGVLGAGLASLLLGALALIGLVMTAAAAAPVVSRGGVGWASLLLGIASAGALVLGGGLAIAGNDSFKAWRSKRPREE